MKHNDIILNNEFLKEHGLVDKVLNYLDLTPSIALSEDELVDVLKDSTVCGYFNGTIKNANELIIERINDNIPTKGILLFTTNLTDISYDMLSGLSMMICKYQGGLDMVVGALRNEKLSEGELEVLFIALK